MIGKKIKLNKEEQNLARILAKLRYQACREQNLHNAKMGEQSDEFTDLEGVASELAFCKLFDIYPGNVIEIRPRSSYKGEDEGGDAIINGISIDVKSTKYMDGRLLATIWKKSNVDCYGLMVGQFPEYEFRGFMLAKDLLQDKRIEDLGRGNGYAAQQYELKEFKDLDIKYSLSTLNSILLQS